MKLRPGETYTRERLDEALRDLYATELFADVQIRRDTGNLVIQVRENPVINRIVLEGNKRLKDDKIRRRSGSPRARSSPAPRPAPTSPASSSSTAARAASPPGRAEDRPARPEPRRRRVRDRRRPQVARSGRSTSSATRSSRTASCAARWRPSRRAAAPTSFFSGGNDSYDPDRLAFDQQKLRQFYLTNGYADFRVVSAVAELTPDRRDFIITYVVEEGERYKFGDVKVESDIRDFKPRISASLPMKTGDWYNAKQVEDTVTSLNETAGLFGYAFADVSPLRARQRPRRCRHLQGRPRRRASMSSGSTSTATPTATR
jgi:outer membrane protein insertion porin family